MIFNNWILFSLALSLALLFLIYQSVFAIPTGSIDPEVTKFSINNLTVITGEYESNLVGKIKNTSNETLYSLGMVVESYNSNNQLIGVDEGSPSYATLGVGQTSPFEVSIDQDIIKDLDHYVIGIKSSNEEPVSLFDFGNQNKNNTTDN